MAAITGATTFGTSPQQNRKQLMIITPATADSADTIDVSSATATGGEVLSSVDFVTVFDQTTGDIVTATVSGTTITLDAAGATTNHTYAVLAIGK